MSSLLFRFRQQYPQGSLRCDLLDIDRGLYLVQASVTVDGIVLGTALAAQGTLEAAEDRARERVLDLLNLSPVSIDTPPPATLTAIATTPPSPPVAPPPPTTPTPAPPLTVKPDPISPVPAPTPPPATPTPGPTTVKPDPITPEVEPELPFTLQSEVYAPPEISETDHQFAQNGTQTPLPMDVNAFTTETLASPEPTLFSQPESPPMVSPEIEGDRLDIPDNLDNLEEPIDFSEIIARSNLELKRLGWTSDQGRNYLLQTYGKRSRQLLSDEQLIEFLAYLEQQPTPE
ncbi:MAG: hypothetical protein VKL20_00295 [Synechocystis sp.]|nr:hypothetical protein [Synechocystis sp.]